MLGTGWQRLHDERRPQRIVKIARDRHRARRHEKLAPTGVDKRDVLHKARSQYHDIVPASDLGFATIWMERRRGKAASEPRPDLNR
jgi:FMN phosphatase YigB (HAD superfamily)